ncbi:hypothetical protein [Zongyangia hominis]|uniref:Uncharacterized protein n=1 Tax=Zongyangia hominis TaxID=2763677 RepID=A0A926EBL0_9FIRM|nr:hypothetical protein [Zongyangia hominis]MBC8569359.1 hypothetical protein [Zongyangia hominis]
MKNIVEHNPFGHPANSDHASPDLPVGFGMALAQDTAAMDRFAHLPEQEKENIIRDIQSSRTGPEAKAKIHDAVARLSESAQM